MDRRTFILAAAAAAMGLDATWAQAPDLDAWLLAEVTGPPGPRDAARVGSLARRDHRLLLGFFRHIGKRWELAAASGVGDRHFASLTSHKTEQRPSYLAEYHEAAVIIAEVRARTGSLDEAYERLLVPVDLPGFSLHTRLGRAQRFVSSELITWIVCQGGFRRFGYANYRGFMGGLFTAVPPPYRQA